MIEYITKRKDVSMDKVNIIYDHYKDTYNIQRQNEKTRNNLCIEFVHYLHVSHY